MFPIAGKGHVITICYDSVTKLIETNSFSSLLWALQLYCRKKKIASEICFWRFDWWRYVGNARFFWSSELPLEWINMISDVLSRLFPDAVTIGLPFKVYWKSRFWLCFLFILWKRLEKALFRDSFWKTRSQKLEHARRPGNRFTTTQLCFTLWK